MIYVLAEDDGATNLGQLGALRPTSPTELRWTISRHVELLRFENGLAGWQCAWTPEHRAAVVASQYSPEIYGLDAVFPAETHRLLTLPRAEVDSGLRRLRLIPLGSSDVLLVYELGIAKIARCRHVDWWQTHGRLDLTLIGADEQTIRFEGQDEDEFVLRASDGQRIA